MSIYYKIKAYLEKDFKLREEVSFEDDNGTITITYWNEESLGKAKPTLDQLNALETEATKLQNNEKIRNKITVSFSSSELRATSIKVSVIREMFDNNQWVSDGYSDGLARKIEDLILTRARELRIKNS